MYSTSIKMASIYINATFQTWDEFFDAVKNHCDATYQPFIKASCKKTSSSNCKLKEGQNEYPEHMPYVYYSYRCTHRGSFKSRSQGLRETKSFKQGCEAKIYACLDRNDRCKIVVKQLNEDHNHETSPEVYCSYVQKRQLTDTEKRRAALLAGLNFPSNSLHQEMQKLTGKMVTKQDIRNIAKKKKLPKEIEGASKKRAKMSSVPSVAANAILVKSEEMPEGSTEVKGYDFNEGVDYKRLFESFSKSGFQATSVGNAVKEINRMIDCKLKPVPQEKMEGINPNPERPLTNCTIFLAYTSNLVSAGTREVIRYLVQHNMVDVLVASAGGVEEDYIKCLAPTYIGDFSLPGRDLRSKGINRIGNLLVPNSNYCKFEDWVVPIFDSMLEEQKEQGTLWTPSKMIWRLGKEIDNPESIYYWAYKNKIPVLCPALTDGSIGDMLFFHSYKNPGLVLDIIQDIRLINSQAVYAVNTGMIILGGGVVKHHTCNANLMRNGADFSVFINTGNEFDGSDSGARPDEAISWGKIKASARPVKVYADASVIFPILVAESFAARQKEIEDLNRRIK